ncbi:MAG TPA: hypothetical protein VGF38_15910 [Ktedonobacterales bacterium]
MPHDVTQSAVSPSTRARMQSREARRQRPLDAAERTWRAERRFV